MGNIFSGSEILEIGVQIEKNGRDFYDTLAKQVKNPKAQGIFGFLAQEEEKHIVVFQNLLGSIEKHEPPESYAGEYSAYMNALAKEYIFTQEDKGGYIARSIKTDSEAVRIGIGFEKDSIIFYEGLKKMVPEYDLKVVSRLIAQEQKHLIQLTELRESL